VLEQLETLNPDYVRKLGEQIDQPQLGPFVGNTDSWNKLAIKRLAQVAQEEGYDKISFSPGSVQYARWPQRYDRKTEQYVDNVGIKVQYDVNVPKAVKKALGVEAKTEDVPIFYRRTDQLNDELDELERTGQVQRNGIIVNVPSPTVDLNEITVTGETVKDKVKAGQSMYAVPIAITAGGLAAIGDPEVAEAEEAEGTGISALPTRSL
jgi:vacuolar-type H+-ATPase subunit F/Vma7